MTETQKREQMAWFARSIFERGLTYGSTGNISVRLDDGWLMTPTGSSMGAIDPARISRLAADGTLLSGDPPTKEAFLHMAMYGERPRTSAVVHLHSTHSVVVSCLCGLDYANVLPALTAYQVMRVGKLPLIPYFPPGDKELAEAVRKIAGRHHCMLLANHGPVVAGRSLEEAVHTTEELEESARLYLLLRGHNYRPLNTEQVSELEARFPAKC
ncbi:MAG TPA: 3-oxo-tetronate 4-phosphate decarboxylase [Devosia sp.]|jgi:ribulose-5-phosphate 4-epimerase/fuculose-1-phosphate aldolase|nr:3-oxo-tetronate 4-phosphate decarboxylase [Devosia sp.]